MKTARSRSLIFIFPAVCFVILTAISMGFRVWAAHKTPELPALGKVGGFSLTERSGRQVSASELAGRIWIADFIFTRCAGPCPLMSAGMKKLQDRLKDPDLRFVSFSVDPDYDTPEVLKAYAARFGASDRWLFLTGPKKEIFRLSREDFLLGAAEDEGEAVLHSTRFVLVDGDGAIRGYYDSTEPDAVGRLISDAANLAASRH